MKTLTRSAIADAIYEQIGLSRKNSEEILDLIIEEIKTELANGHSVKISSFGSFCLHQKKARIGRNPKTGVEAEITPRTVISFRPAQGLRKTINGIK